MVFRLFFSFGVQVLVGKVKGGVETIRHMQEMCVYVSAKALFYIVCIAVYVSEAERRI